MSNYQNVVTELIGRKRYCAILLAYFTSAVVVPATPGSADNDWKTVVEPPGLYGDTHSGVIGLYMEAELLAQKRLRRGMEFWRKYSDDPRRLEWLQMMANMPPHFPIDIVRWATKEASLGPNTEPLNEVALKAWMEEYNRRRAEYWDSLEGPNPRLLNGEQARELRRRQLHFAELKGKIKRHRELAASGKVENGKIILKYIVDYVKRFQKPQSESDRNTHRYSTLALIIATIQNPKDLQLTAYDIEEFAATLEREGCIINVRSIAERMAAGTQDAVASPPSGWRLLPHLMPIEEPVFAAERMALAVERELTTQKYRESGIDLWKIEPIPEQGAIWMSNALAVAPDYPRKLSSFLARKFNWQEGGGAFDYDEEAEIAWRNKCTQLISEILSVEGVDETTRASVREAEIRSRLKLQAKKWARSADRNDVPGLKKDIAGMILTHGFAEEAFQLVNEMIRDSYYLGVSREEAKEFLLQVQSWNDDNMRKLAEGKLRYLELRERPLEFNARTIEGKPFDLRELRGKVVLVDCWITTCGSCIAAMPMIEEVYRKYKSDGFEVVSVCFDYDKAPAFIDRLRRELKLESTFIRGDDQWQEFSDKYALYGGFPHYLLLDREGRLIAGTSELDQGKALERVLLNALNGKAQRE